MSQGFEQYQRFHSFVLLQSRRAKLEQHLPWALFSRGKHIDISEELHPDRVSNYNFDCSFYQHNGKKLVLAQAGAVGGLFPAYKQQRLRQEEFLELQEPIRSQTYIYAPSTRNFLQCDPVYLHRNGIILFDATALDELAYQTLQPPPGLPGIVYHFSSEYAIASDDHFLNCLHRGPAEVGSYLKTDSGKIYPFVSEQVFKWVNSLYPAAKL